ncbi:unnamed protein product [Amoebophrya sp. A120]|nr:unnamed protein product [Amoebophrya sp. A120]|eukprot:GSA120T00023000001.1
MQQQPEHLGSSGGKVVGAEPAQNAASATLSSARGSAAGSCSAKNLGHYEEPKHMHNKRSHYSYFNHYTRKSSRDTRKQEDYRSTNDKFSGGSSARRHYTKVTRQCAEPALGHGVDAKMSFPVVQERDQPLVGSGTTATTYKDQREIEMRKIGRDEAAASTAAVGFPPPSSPRGGAGSASSQKTYENSGKSTTATFSSRHGGAGGRGYLTSPQQQGRYATTQSNGSTTLHQKHLSSSAQLAGSAFNMASQPQPSKTMIGGSSKKCGFRAGTGGSGSKNFYHHQGNALCSAPSSGNRTTDQEKADAAIISSLIAESAKIEERKETVFMTVVLPEGTQLGVRISKKIGKEDLQIFLANFLAAEKVLTAVDFPRLSWRRIEFFHSSLPRPQNAAAAASHAESSASRSATKSTLGIGLLNSCSSKATTATTGDCCVDNEQRDDAASSSSGPICSASSFRLSLNEQNPTLHMRFSSCHRLFLANREGVYSWTRDHNKNMTSAKDLQEPPPNHEGAASLSSHDRSDRSTIAPTKARGDEERTEVEQEVVPPAPTSRMAAQFFPHANATCVAASRCGQFLFTGDRDGTICVWDDRGTSSSQEDAPTNSSRATAGVPSPPSASSSCDPQAGSGTTTSKEDNIDPRARATEKFSAQNEKARRASPPSVSSSGSATTASASKLLTLRAHRDQISSLILSKDGRYLYSASYDNVVLRWNLQQLHSSAQEKLPDGTRVKVEASANSCGNHFCTTAMCSSFHDTTNRVAPAARHAGAGIKPLGVNGMKLNSSRLPQTRTPAMVYGVRYLTASASSGPAQPQHRTPERFLGGGHSSNTGGAQRTTERTSRGLADAGSTSGVYFSPAVTYGHPSGAAEGVALMMSADTREPCTAHHVGRNAAFIDNQNHQEPPDYFDRCAADEQPAPTTIASGQRFVLQSGSGLSQPPGEHNALQFPPGLDFDDVNPKSPPRRAKGAAPPGMNQQKVPSQARQDDHFDASSRTVHPQRPRDEIADRTMGCIETHTTQRYYGTPGLGAGSSSSSPSANSRVVPVSSHSHSPYSCAEGSASSFCPINAERMLARLAVSTCRSSSSSSFARPPNELHGSYRGSVGPRDVGTISHSLSANDPRSSYTGTQLAGDQQRHHLHYDPGQSSSWIVSTTSFDGPPPGLTPACLQGRNHNRASNYPNSPPAVAFFDAVEGAVADSRRIATSFPASCSREHHQESGRPRRPVDHIALMTASPTSTAQCQAYLSENGEALLPLPCGQRQPSNQDFAAAGALVVPPVPAPLGGVGARPHETQAYDGLSLADGGGTTPVVAQPTYSATYPYYPSTSGAAVVAATVGGISCSAQHHHHQKMVPAANVGTDIATAAARTTGDIQPGPPNIKMVSRGHQMTAQSCRGTAAEASTSSATVENSALCIYGARHEHQQEPPHRGSGAAQCGTSWTTSITGDTHAALAPQFQLSPFNFNHSCLLNTTSGSYQQVSGGQVLFSCNSYQQMAFSPTSLIDEIGRCGSLEISPMYLQSPREQGGIAVVDQHIPHNQNLGPNNGRQGGSAEALTLTPVSKPPGGVCDFYKRCPPSPARHRGSDFEVEQKIHSRTQENLETVLQNPVTNEQNYNLAETVEFFLEGYFDDAGYYQQGAAQQHSNSTTPVEVVTTMPAPPKAVSHGLKTTGAGILGGTVVPAGITGMISTTATQAQVHGRVHQGQDPAQHDSTTAVDLKSAMDGRPSCSTSSFVLPTPFLHQEVLTDDHLLPTEPPPASNHIINVTTEQSLLTATDDEPQQRVPSFPDFVVSRDASSQCSPVAENVSVHVEYVRKASVGLLTSKHTPIRSTSSNDREPEPAAAVGRAFHEDGGKKQLQKQHEDIVPTASDAFDQHADETLMKNSCSASSSNGTTTMTTCSSKTSVAADHHDVDGIPEDLLALFAAYGDSATNTAGGPVGTGARMSSSKQGGNGNNMLNNHYGVTINASARDFEFDSAGGWRGSTPADVAVHREVFANKNDLYEDRNYNFVVSTAAASAGADATDEQHQQRETTKLSAQAQPLQHRTITTRPGIDVPSLKMENVNGRRKVEDVEEHEYKQQIMKIPQPDAFAAAARRPVSATVVAPEANPVRSNGSLSCAMDEQEYLAKNANSGGPPRGGAKIVSTSTLKNSQQDETPKANTVKLNAAGTTLSSSTTFSASGLLRKEQHADPQATAFLKNLLLLDHQEPVAVGGPGLNEGRTEVDALEQELASPVLEEATTEPETSCFQSSTSQCGQKTSMTLMMPPCSDDLSSTTARRSEGRQYGAPAVPALQHLHNDLPRPHAPGRGLGEDATQESRGADCFLTDQEKNFIQLNHDIRTKREQQVQLTAVGREQAPGPVQSFTTTRPVTAPEATHYNGVALHSSCPVHDTSASASTSCAADAGTGFISTAGKSKTNGNGAIMPTRTGGQHATSFSKPSFWAHQKYREYTTCYASNIEFQNHFLPHWSSTAVQAEDDGLSAQEKHQSHVAQPPPGFGNYGFSRVETETTHTTEATSRKNQQHSSATERARPTFQRKSEGLLCSKFGGNYTPQPVYALALSGDERELYAASGFTVKKFETHTRKFIGEYQGHHDYVIDVAVSTTYGKLATVSDDMTAICTDLTGESRLDLSGVDSQSGKDPTIAACAGTTGWGGNTNNTSMALESQDNYRTIFACTFSHCGRYLYLVLAHRVKKWCMKRLQCVALFDAPKNSRMAGCAVSPCGNLLYVSLTNRVVVFDACTGQMLPDAFLLDGITYVAVG